MNSKIRALTIGAATQDVFLSGKALIAKRDVRTHDYVEQFPLGAKLDMEAVHFDTGGGAANAAVTFARQGFDVSFVGKVGHDPAGSEILRVLRRERVSTDHVAYDSAASTSYSTILLAPNGERTILNYRGASHNLRAGDYAIRSFDCDWIYISSLAGNLDLLSRVLKHANRHGIQVAINPGAAEIKQAKKLRAILPLVTVLAGNKEELSQLFEETEIPRILGKAAAMCSFVSLTDGPRGSFTTDGRKLYQAGQYQKVKVVDRLGSGDAFASGLVAAIAMGLPVEDAITLGSANSTSVVQKIGAKAGILRTHRLRRMKIKVSDL